MLCVPVSYTHLDVYKRQLSLSADKLTGGEEEEELSGFDKWLSDHLGEKITCLLYTSEKARAGHVDVKTGAAAGAQAVLHHARQAGGDGVRADGGCDDHIQLLGLSAAVLQLSLIHI